ncbi:endonuclease V [Candidatus Woesearchaeota archaeon]|jgi:deoxyribonuclease V|nr:endonuclease V [Candidatus Woesearchaeota archaeon]MBT7367701.1 endonuclease V [Candidatus Woesearchaeota archaeon]
MLKKRELKKEQEKFAKKVITTDNFDDIKLIAGVDQAFIDDKIISGIVVLDIKTMEIVDKKYAVVETEIPYIPGYMAYREAPAVVEAFHKLTKKPDLLVIDGNGILHPRRIGMATHIGILLDTPTIGVTKSQSIGELKEDTVYVEKEARAKKIATKEHANPIFISPGHKISLKTSIEIIKDMMKGHKLPEPLHIAHSYSNKIKKKLQKKEK